MNEFFSIGEVASLYNVSIDTLRYYDKLGLLKPGVRKKNGYRYYCWDQLDKLELLLTARSLNVPLQKISSAQYDSDLSTFESVITDEIYQSKIQMKKLKKIINDSNNFLNIIKKYQKIDTEHSLEIVEEYVNYTFIFFSSRVKLLNAIHSESKNNYFSVAQCSCLTKNNDILEGMILPDSTLPREDLDIKKIEGTYKKVLFIGCLIDILNLWERIRISFSDVVECFILYDFGYPLQGQEKVQHCVTIYFKSKTNANMINNYSYS
ncbi:MerR family DNA-binding transcriptional regulator [Enterococcus ureasiticus]|uniref:HTH merR-type domain-containing protein n=1 Tax=Enterococcus ureasiticus TaxID=903984 RepID=A0A1E5GHJ9_9ENTE|nr:MerR family DNA-binding transcriptional regulator [Enterococcus ureasiticus]OEG12188.1 hypothetical protein BCR21_08100 [Enterococcus ureasiticus]